MTLPSQMDRAGENRASGGGPGTGMRTGIIVLGLLALAGGIYLISMYLPKQGTLTGTGTTELPPIGTDAFTRAGTDKSGGITDAVTPTGTETPTTIARQGIVDPDAIPAQGAVTPTGNTTGLPALTADPKAGTVTPVGTALTTGLGTSPTTTTLGAPGTPIATGTAAWLEAGDRALASSRPVEARTMYSKALLSRDTSGIEKETLRAKIATINEDLLFSPRVDALDALVEGYKVQSGDSLVRIAKRRELATDWRLIQRVNRIANPNNLRVGQTLKLVKGPFHAVVNKSEYRVDVYAGTPGDPSSWVYVKSMRCGLGEGNSTPMGEYIVKRNSKLIDPPWTNPRTGERFASNDPKNPIGEHWIGWQGVGDAQVNVGYGFHGTIDTESVGQQLSMGCVRLGAEDVALLYELLVEDVSVVRVLP